MSTSRRKFLEMLGMGLAAPHLLGAQEQEKPQRKGRSPFTSMFENPETKAPRFKPEPSTWSPDTITASWLGHSTVLVNFYGTTIITDPMFAERAGVRIPGLGTFGPKRLNAPALRFDELPPIDLILISHGHMDHCDNQTLRKFNRDIPLVMAKNTSDIVDHLGRTSVIELDWGERCSVAGVEIEGMRVRHFGWRYPWEPDRSGGDWYGRSFNAYLVSKGGRSFVFGGDMGYHEYFKPVGMQGVNVELAIMPIGTYDPWIHNHCNPEQAVAMADHLGARCILPIHHTTFVMSQEPVEEPLERFKAALAATPHRIALEEVGQTWTKNNHTAG